MTTATPRQLEYLAAVASLTARLGIPPTHGQVAHELGVSRVSGSNALHRLVRRGLVAMQPNGARSMRVTDDGRALLEAMR